MARSPSRMSRSVVSSFCEWMMQRLNASAQADSSPPQKVENPRFTKKRSAPVKAPRRFLAITQPQTAFSFSVASRCALDIGSLGVEENRDGFLHADILEGGRRRIIKLLADDRLGFRNAKVTADACAGEEADGFHARGDKAFYDSPRLMH